MAVSSWGVKLGCLDYWITGSDLRVVQLGEDLTFETVWSRHLCQAGDAIQIQWGLFTKKHWKKIVISENGAKFGYPNSKRRILEGWSVGSKYYMRTGGAEMTVRDWRLNLITYNSTVEPITYSITCIAYKHKLFTTMIYLVGCIAIIMSQGCSNDSFWIRLN